MDAATTRQPQLRATPMMTGDLCCCDSSIKILVTRQERRINAPPCQHKDAQTRLEVDHPQAPQHSRTTRAYFAHNSNRFIESQGVAECWQATCKLSDKRCYSIATVNRLIEEVRLRLNLRLLHAYRLCSAVRAFSCPSLEIVISSSILCACAGGDHARGCRISIEGG